MLIFLFKYKIPTEKVKYMSMDCRVKCSYLSVTTSVSSKYNAFINL